MPATPADRVGSSVVLVRDGDAIDRGRPGDGRSALADPRSAGRPRHGPEAVTHVFLSHHHPDHTVNVALFPNAEVVDFWARYKDDLWLDHDGDGYALAPHSRLWLTPGHTEEDATLVVEADDGVYAMTHLWWYADRTPEVDPLGADQAAIVSAAARGCSPRPTSSSPATARRSGFADPDRRVPTARRPRARWSSMPAMPVGYVGAHDPGRVRLVLLRVPRVHGRQAAPSSPAHLGHPRDLLRAVRAVRGLPDAAGPCPRGPRGDGRRPRSRDGPAHHEAHGHQSPSQADLYEVPKDKHKH